MKTHGEMTLEKYRLFPYIAWLLIIGFALFTINLVTELKETAEELVEKNDTLHMTVSDHSKRLDSLEEKIAE
ncbi:hypothetical protein KC845_02900 [Candidatus Kaiserbacteria bacterium]|nr:hypothetical protein [Candidatus Kaiserbacteria bacterium]